MLKHYSSSNRRSRDLDPQWSAGKRIQSSKEVPDPATSLLPATPDPCCSSSLGCFKAAGKEKHPLDSLAEWQRGGGGWRRARSPGKLFLGKLQSALRVHLPAVSV
ncbi:hypothetical protein Nmel_005838 [Mimus melanotis]